MPTTNSTAKNKPFDGFNAKSTFGVLTFYGFTCTITYNGHNYLSIFFTSGNFVSNQNAKTISHKNTHIAALLASPPKESTAIGSEANITKAQRRLLSKHRSMGHLNMTSMQKLARDGKFVD